MATVIDALVVTLGLDTSGYKKASDDAIKQSEKKKRALTKDEKEQEDLEKRRNQALTKYQKDLDERNEKNIRGVANLATEFLGLFGVIEGASGIKDFLNGVINTNLSVGQLAHNLDVSTEDLSVWQNAIGLTGGKTEDLNGSLSSLVNTFQAGIHGQMTPAVGALRTLGIQFSDLQNPLQGLYEIGQKLRALPPQQANYLASLIGIGPDTLRLLEQNDAAFNQTMEDAKRGNQITGQSVEEAKAAKAAVEGWNQALNALGNTLAVAVLPNLTKFVKGLTDEVSILKNIVTGNWGGAWAAIQSQGLDQLGGMGIGPKSPAGVGGGIAWEAPPGGGFNWDGRQQATTSNASGPIADFFVKRGFTPDQAQGIAAGIQAESGSNPNARNPDSGAYGIGQWLGDRKRRLFQMFGPNPGLQQQLQFLSYELKGGDRGGAAVRNAGSAEDALRAYITQFMRPAAGYETARDIFSGLRTLNGVRAGVATPGVQASGPREIKIAQIGPIYTQATDAKGIGKDIGGAVRKYGFVPMADGGVQ